MMNLESVSKRARSLASIVLLAPACAAPLERSPATQTPSSLTAQGEQIYVGTVFPLGVREAAPAFVYERRVSPAGEWVVSTHITRDALGGVALAESATHTPDYELVDYTLHANQLGQTGGIHVERGRVSFRRSDSRGEVSEVEEQSDAVAVGPTLVGYIVKHLAALRGGDSLKVRMAVLERLETIGFELRASESDAGQTRVEMTPSSFVLALLIEPIVFTFETSSSKLVRLEGRVPPKLDEHGSLRDFDARVEYRFTASEYR